MNTLSLVISVINRTQEKEFIDFFHRYQCPIVYSMPCHGTTKHTLLQYLGLEVTEKRMILSMIDSSISSSLLTSMLYDMDLDHAGNGICLVIPIHSICSQSYKYYEYSSQELSSKLGGMKMDTEQFNHQPAMYELIIAITNNGYNDLVMDAARNASASGGTVIHAKSTATEQMRRFLGISIVEEKEILLIVVKQEQKSGIMKEIQKTAGTHTPAGTILFSVPVTSIAGLHFYPDSQEKPSIE